MRSIFNQSKRSCQLALTAFSMAIILLSIVACTQSPASVGASPLLLEEKLVWVYTHTYRDGVDYTVFSTEKPINKGQLPRNFLAIKNREKEIWTCLLRWEGDVLWFYTPASRSFASHNSEDGKTNWTIIEDPDYNRFFSEDFNSGFIRFSNECGRPEVLCLDAEEVVIGQ